MDFLYTGYFVLVLNYTIGAIYKVDIFMDMDEDQISKELTELLSKLNKGDRVDMGQVVHGLSDVERDIFFEALNQKGQRDKKYTDLMKDTED